MNFELKNQFSITGPPDYQYESDVSTTSTSMCPEMEGIKELDKRDQEYKHLVLSRLAFIYTSGRSFQFKIEIRGLITILWGFNMKRSVIVECCRRMKLGPGFVRNYMNLAESTIRNEKNIVRKLTTEQYSKIEEAFTPTQDDILTLEENRSWEWRNFPKLSPRQMKLFIEADIFDYQDDVQRSHGGSSACHVPLIPSPAPPPQLDIPSTSPFAFQQDSYFERSGQPIDLRNTWEVSSQQDNLRSGQRPQGPINAGYNTHHHYYAPVPLYQETPLTPSHDFHQANLIAAGHTYQQPIAQYSLQQDQPWRSLSVGTTAQMGDDTANRESRQFQRTQANQGERFHPYSKPFTKT